MMEIQLQQTGREGKEIAIEKRGRFVPLAGFVITAYKLLVES